MSFPCTKAVQLICDKLNDPNRETYANEDYSGHAYDVFWECINELLIMDSFKNEDVHGLISELSVTIPEDGIVDINDEEPNVFRIVGYYSNQGNPDVIEKSIKEVGIDFFNQMQGKDFLDGNTVLTYRVGKFQKFYPPGFVSGKQVNLIFLKYPEKSLSENLLDLFSSPFIHKAILLAAEKIIKTRGIE